MNKLVTCKKCNKDGLIWVKSKAGNYYLADPEYVSFGEGQHKLINFAHKCAVVSNLPKSFNDVRIAELQSLISKMQKALESDVLESDKVFFRDSIAEYQKEISELS